MRQLIIISLFLALAAGSHFILDEDDPIEPFDELDEDEFEDLFNVPPADTIEEEIEREEALEEHEKQIHDTNLGFLSGETSWFETLDEYSNLPDDEFQSIRTGAKGEEEMDGYARGLIVPENPPVDERSERYFAEALANRQSIPDSYNAVEEGIVTPVKNQGQCGSCVAFATMSTVETCFKKETGEFGDYAEQQFVDCGYDEKTAWGCDGAYMTAYLNYGKEHQLIPAHESQYPYIAGKTKYKCPDEVPQYNLGSRMADLYYTYKGNETLMKEMVYRHGSISVMMATDGGFSSYRGGIFAGCKSTKRTHAVVIVGYGSENGQDYWLIKNSWGTRWGEQGYMRLARGVNMCQIERYVGVAICSPKEETVTTNAPITTASPCEDNRSNCSDFIDKCYQKKVQKNCQKSCGLCPGMKPAPSYLCYNKNKKCAASAKTKCFKPKIQKSCKKACGLCEGMTPVPSVTCYDRWSNCSELCDNEKKKNECKKSCGLC